MASLRNTPATPAMLAPKAATTAPSKAPAPVRSVDARIAGILQKFKAFKTDTCRVVLESGKAGERSFGKTVGVDELAAMFYRQGAELVVTPEGKLTWKLAGVTYEPQY